MAKKQPVQIENDAEETKPELSVEERLAALEETVAAHNKIHEKYHRSDLPVAKPVEA